MTTYACLFEAKSIQAYILRSGRLRHVVGASELLDSLTPIVIDDVVAALDIPSINRFRFSRKAGGAVYLFTDDEASRDAFHDIWALAVRQYAPGLELIIATGQGPNEYEAYEAAQKTLQGARNRQPPLLPAGTPVTRYAPRTGEPAVASDRKLGLQDEATVRFGLDRFWRSGGLARRFAPDLPVDAWPRNLEYDPDNPQDAAFPFWPDNRYLGLLHADGNGLGALLLALGKHAKANPKDFVPLFWDFSAAVSEATKGAAQRATEEVLLLAQGDTWEEGGARPEVGLIPARPIVLGGDDLTLLIRADLALPFARAFLTAFEKESRDRLRPLKARYPQVPDLPEALTAGAGIAFVKSSHPFHLAYELAEALARHAKDRAKAGLKSGERVPPSIAFHRVTTACHGDYRSILEGELTSGTGEAAIRTSLGAYGVDAEGPLPALADLESLAKLLACEDMARGPARQILTLIGQDRDDAGRRYQRWRELMAERKTERDDPLASFDEHLGRLCGNLADRLPVSVAGTPRLTPLGDLAALLAVTQGAAPKSETTKEEGQ